jgi:hypothetical protein
MPGLVVRIAGTVLRAASRGGRNLECGEQRRFGILKRSKRCKNAKAAMLAALQIDPSVSLTFSGGT